jgi:phosphoribosylformylglycinamidine synthase
VQVGDPFTEKLLLEACLELMQTDAIVGIQDMGAAGLTSSSFEMAGRAGTGIRLDLDKVPMRESGMTPYELMLSESQERMLIVAKKGREQDVLDIFAKWDLDAAVIGEVTGDGHARLFWRGQLAAAIPVDPISTEAPVYQRPIAEPASRRSIPERLERPAELDGDLTGRLFRLLASPNLCSKAWIWEQYDTSVRTNTIAKPERSDAAVVRIKGTRRALAISTDVNPVYCALDPYEGGKQAVAEAARNVACSGARPAAITDCLNFGSPERPEIMWQFAESIRGISDACRALETPVVSGNVSFYNETEGRPVNPTPTIGMVGILDDAEHVLGCRFRDAGEAIILLGSTRDELGGSEYQQVFHADATARPPRVELDAERALVELLLELRAEGRVSMAHDLANGGLAVALAEAAMDGVGVDIDLGAHADDVDAVALLFGESQGRAIVAAPEEQVSSVLATAEIAGVPAFRVGTTVASAFLVSRKGMPLLRTSAQELGRIWREAFPKLLAGDSADEIIEGKGEVAELIPR